MSFGIQKASWGVDAYFPGGSIIVETKIETEFGGILDVNVEISIVVNSYLNIVGIIEIDTWNINTKASERCNHCESKRVKWHSLIAAPFVE